MVLIFQKYIGQIIIMVLDVIFIRTTRPINTKSIFIEFKKIKYILVVFISYVIQHASFFLTCILLAFVLVLIVDMTVYKASPYNLVSICGIFIYVFLCFVTSVNPSKASLLSEVLIEYQALMKYNFLYNNFESEIMA